MTKTTRTRTKTSSVLRIVDANPMDPASDVLHRVLAKADSIECVVVVYQERGPKGTIHWDGTRSSEVSKIQYLVATALFSLQCMVMGIEKK